MKRIILVTLLAIASPFIAAVWFLVASLAFQALATTAFFYAFGF
jgi:hypothetical protein